MKRLRVAAITISILAGILLTVTAVATNYFYDLAIDANSSKNIIASVNETQSVSQQIDAYNYKKWMVSESGFYHLYLTSEDGLRLHNYAIQNKEKTHKYAVLVHGYTCSGLSMAGMAKYFYNRNYHIIVPDLRGHGKSEGDYIGMGWDDRFDLMRVINYIIEEDNQAQIVLAGVSMGASAVLMLSGEKLPKNVVAMIEDCGYTSVWEEFSYVLGSVFSLPNVPFLYTTDWLTRYRAGYSFKEASAIDQVRKSSTPTLFIHGTKDTFVPFYMLDELYDACSAEKEKLIVKGAGHAQSMDQDPTLYQATISRFLSAYDM